MALYGVGKAPIETSACCAVVPSELCNDSLLALLNDKEAGGQPNQDRNDCSYAKKATYLLEIGIKATSATARWRIAATTVLTQKFAELTVEFPPQFI
jgi:hypothetical protein